MAKLRLTDIERFDHLSKEDFVENYLKPNKPVVFRNFAANWPALKKWTYDYLKQGCGEVKVPLYDGDFASGGADYMAAKTTMTFAEYLELIQKEPTQLRMFLFNVFKYMPQLMDDFHYPDIGVKFIKGFPFLFCGGEGSYVDLHYDLDLSHVFLTQFTGKKQVVLFPPDASKHLYQHPLTVSTNVNLLNLDLNRYPKIAEADGYQTVLSNGDTLFIPSRWWHFIEYKTAGISMSLRAVSQGYWQMSKGVVSIAKLKYLDANIGRLLGSKNWYQIKEKIAHKRAEKL